jgi:hypothetical protein
MTADANPNALDLGLDATAKFYDLVNTSVSLPHAEKVAANIVDKAFGARPSTLARGKAVLFKIMEVSDPTVVATLLLTKLTDKRPKIPPACLETIMEGMNLFGGRHFPIKEILKSLPPVFNSSNGASRDGAMTLLYELHRWIGPAPIAPLLEQLRPAQKTDFEKLVAEKAENPETNKPPVPSLYLRKEKHLIGQETTVAKASAADGRDFLEEVDLAKKLKSSNYSEGLASDKWMEQVNGMELIIAAIGPTPKIKAGPIIHEIVTICHEYLKNGHLQVQTKACKLLSLFAEGLRKQFSPDIRPLMQTILLKSKEKKLTTDVSKLCELIFIHQCVNFDGIAEDLLELVKNKKSPPHCRICLSQIFTHQVSVVGANTISIDNMKACYNAFLANTEESDVKVREESVKALAAIYAHFPLPSGPTKGRPNEVVVLFQALNTANAKLMKKIQSLAAEGSSGAGSSDTASAAVRDDVSVASTSTAGSTSVASSKGPVRSSTSGIAGLKGALNSTTGSTNSDTSDNAPPSATSTASAKPPASAAAAARRASATGGTGGSAAGSASTKSAAAAVAADDDGNDDVTMTSEVAYEQLQSFALSNDLSIDWEAFPKLLESAKWQEKVDAFTLFGQQFSSVPITGDILQCIYAIASIGMNKWKISNMNVWKGCLDMFESILNSPQLNSFLPAGKPVAMQLLEQSHEKLSDKKLQPVVEKLYMILISKCGGKLILKRLNNLIYKIKSPIVHQNYLAWLKSFINDIGMNEVPILQMAQFCVKEMENKVAAIRTGAIEYMGCIYHRVGPPFVASVFTKDCDPHVKEILEKEFQRVGFDASKAKAGATGDGGGMEDLPRRDIMELLDKNIFNELTATDGKDAWQVRKLAMEHILAACNNSGHYLEYNKNSAEIIKALKLRLNDTQSNLKPIAVNCISHVFASLPSDKLVKAFKPYIGSILIGLCDNKKVMKDATITALDCIISGNTAPPPGDSATNVEVKVDVPVFMSIVASSHETLMNVTGRGDMLAWFLAYIECFTGDCNELVPGLVSSLQDKVANVRNGAEEVFSNLVSKGLISKMGFEKGTRDLAPAAKRAIQASLDRIASFFETAAFGGGNSLAIALGNAAGGNVRGSISAGNSNNTSPAGSPAKPVAAAPAASAPMNQLHRQSSAQQLHAVQQVPVQQAPPPQSYAPPPQHYQQPHVAPQPAPVSLPPPDVIAFLPCPPKVTRRQLWLSWPQPPIEPSVYDYVTVKNSWKDFMTAKALQGLFTESAPLHNAVYTLNQLMYADLGLFVQHTDFVFRYLCSKLYTAKTTYNSENLQLIADFVHSFLQNLHAKQTMSNSLGTQFSFEEWSLLFSHFWLLLLDTGVFTDKQQYGGSVWGLMKAIVGNALGSPSVLMRTFLPCLATSRILTTRLVVLQYMIDLLTNYGQKALDGMDTSSLFHHVNMHNTTMDMNEMSLYQKILQLIANNDAANQYQAVLGGSAAAGSPVPGTPRANPSPATYQYNNVANAAPAAALPPSTVQVTAPPAQQAPAQPVPPAQPSASPIGANPSSAFKSVPAVVNHQPDIKLAKLNYSAIKSILSSINFRAQEEILSSSQRMELYEHSRVLISLPREVRQMTITHSDAIVLSILSISILSDYIKFFRNNAVVDVPLISCLLSISMHLLPSQEVYALLTTEQLTYCIHKLVFAMDVLSMKQQGTGMKVAGSTLLLQSMNSLIVQLVSESTPSPVTMLSILSDIATDILRQHTTTTTNVGSAAISAQQTLIGLKAIVRLIVFVNQMIEKLSSSKELQASNIQFSLLFIRLHGLMTVEIASPNAITAGASANSILGNLVTLPIRVTKTNWQGY